MALSKRTLASFSAATDGATTLSVTPTGMQEGDWIFIGVNSAGGTGAHSNTAGGMSRATAADIALSTVGVCSTWKKKCAAGESGTTYTFSFGGSTRRAVVEAVCYSGGDGTDAVESAPAGVASGAGATSLAVTGVDPAATGGVHLVFAFARTAAGVQQDFNTVTNYPKLEAEVSSNSAGSTNANMAIYGRALPDASATGDITFTVVTGDRLGGASILLKPASGTDVTDDAKSTGPLVGSTTATSAADKVADAKSVGPTLGTTPASSQVALASDVRSVGALVGTTPVRDDLGKGSAAYSLGAWPSSTTATAVFNQASNAYSAGPMVGSTTAVSSLATAVTDDAVSSGPMVAATPVVSAMNKVDNAYSVGPSPGSTVASSGVSLASSARSVGAWPGSGIRSSAISRVNDALSVGPWIGVTTGASAVSKTDRALVTAPWIGSSYAQSNIGVAGPLSDDAKSLGFWPAGIPVSSDFGSPLADSGGPGIIVDITPRAISVDIGRGIPEIDLAPGSVG